MISRNVVQWALLVRWQLRRVFALARRTYGAWSIGSVGVAIAAIITFAGSHSLAKQAATVRSEIIEARRTHERPRIESRNDLEHIAEIEAALPSAALIPQIVEKLIALAGQEKLVLQEGEYKLTSAAATVQTYRIRFPISGDAAAIQRFVLAAIDQHRTLGLEALQVRREQVDSLDAEANVQFVLIVAPPTPTANIASGPT